jgi:hypothetical protein
MEVLTLIYAGVFAMIIILAPIYYLIEKREAAQKDAERRKTQS